MVLARCPFCTHTNPRGARFCNECGSPLHLRPCEHCEAVNDVLARQCYRCNAPLRPDRALTPIGMTAEERNIAPALEATTVIAAYGNESTQRRSRAPWLDAHVDDARASPPIDDDLLEAPDPRREPRLGDLSIAQVEARDVDAPAIRPARYVAALIGVLVIAGLAALGSYTFVQRGVAQIESAEPDAPASPAGLRSDSFDTAPSAKPEAVVPPASAASPAADAPPASEAPAASDAPAAAAGPASTSNAPTTSDGAPAASPPARAASAATKRKPAAMQAAPPASQDAIETEKIITRELRGASPPQPR